MGMDVGESMSRRTLLAVSVVAHIALGVLLFVTGVWRIERLDAGRAEYSLAVMMPPAAPEGGPAPGEKPKDVRKDRRKRVVKDVQPEPRQPETKEVTTGSIGSGEGSGSGSGTGTDPLGTGTCEGDACGPPGPPVVVVAAVCGNGIREEHETCDDGNQLAGDGCSASCTSEPPKVSVVPPTVLQGLRLSGDTQVHPPDTVKTEMLRDGKDRAIGVLKLCIATDGGISSVAIASSTRYPAYDARLVSAARAWRYQPYRLDGRPLPVCSTVTFVYTIH